MSAEWLNLVAFAAILVIVAGAAAIFYVVATRQAGRKGTGMAKPPQAHHRQINPKTGDRFQ